MPGSQQELSYLPLSHSAVAQLPYHGPTQDPKSMGPEAQVQLHYPGHSPCSAASHSRLPQGPQKSVEGGERVREETCPPVHLF